MEQLKQMVKMGEIENTQTRVVKLLKSNSPDAILNQSLIPAMDEVGELYQKGEFFLPEMLMAARTMKAGLKLLKPLLVAKGLQAEVKVVIGTVEGDLHDIGKNLVGMALEGAGFEVIDLGMDVGAQQFVTAIQEYKPVAVALSAMLTTTMVHMENTLRAIESAGLRDQVKVMVGGAPVSEDYAQKIGADFYGQDPATGKDFVRNLIEKTED